MKLLPLIYHHLYHAFASSYDLIAWLVSLGRWRAWVLSALPHIEGPRVLELGHGPGHLQAAMRKKGWLVLGLDESRQMGRLAALRLTRLGLPVALIRSEAQTLPFAPASFDSLAATFPTQYIFERRTLDEASRVLRPGGRLVIVPTAWVSGENLADRATAWLFRVTKQGEAITEALEPRLKAPLTAAGFKVRLETARIRSSTVLIIIATKT